MNDITITDYITMLGVIVAAIGVSITAWQLCRGNGLTSANSVAQCLKEFAADKDMQEIFYAIEYGDFKYGPGFHGSPEERLLDKLLQHFSVVALLWKNGFIKPTDLVTIKYYVVRIMGNEEVKKYVNGHLQKWVKRKGIEHPYQPLNSLAKHLENHPPRKN